MIRRLAAAGLVVSTVALSLVAPAPAHAADGSCVITGITPTAVNVGLSPVKTTFNVKTTGCQVSYWAIEADGELIYDSQHKTETFFPQDDNDYAGYYEFTAYASNADGKETRKTIPYALKITRRTEWRDFNASPEPVTKGKTITVKGQLVRVNWESRKYAPYTGRTAKVQFKAKGTSSWATVKTVKTSSTGRVSAAVKATKDGTFRVVYSGSDISGAATSASDFVDVR